MYLQERKRREIVLIIEVNTTVVDTSKFWIGNIALVLL
jgi:hypothetical protein